MNSKEKLAKYLEEAGASENFIQRAKDGFYADFESPLMLPITELVTDARRQGLLDIAERAINGEFYATEEEARAWEQSAEYKGIMRRLTGGKE